MCLQPVNGSLGAAIVQEPCNGSAAQQWTEEPGSASNTLHFVNGSSGLCLDARGGATNATPIEQWTCDWITNENWGNSVENNLMNENLVSRVSGTDSYSISTPGPASGDAMVLYSNDGATSEIFSFIQI
jgi:hypothetical protein